MKINLEIVETQQALAESLGIEDLKPWAPSAAQRRALYRMGRSPSWVRKYAKNKAEAARLIDTAIEEMTRLKSN